MLQNLRINDFLIAVKINGGHACVTDGEARAVKRIRDIEHGTQKEAAEALVREERNALFEHV